MRAIHWPVYGDRGVFRRTAALAGIAGGVVVVALAVAAGFAIPKMVSTIVPLSVAVLMLELLWAHSLAQSRARRAEIVGSFAGLTVVHQGQAIRVEDAPLVGEYGSRRSAARAAMDRGGWAVIVKAYERFYVLAGTRTTEVGSPVAFRTRAVADVVPALRLDDVLAS